MGKQVTKGFTEVRVYIESSLAKKLQKKAEDEKRTYGKQLEVILEQYFQPSKGEKNA